VATRTRVTEASWLGTIILMTLMGLVAFALGYFIHPM
jgi:hypothetical protein